MDTPLIYSLVVCVRGRVGHAAQDVVDDLKLAAAQQGSPQEDLD